MNKVGSLFIFCSLFAGFSFSTPVVQAAQTLLSYEEATVMALQGNPDLVALRMQEEAFKFRARQALSPNSPTASVTKNDLVNPSPFSQPAITILGLSFTLGFPGKAFAAQSQLDHQSMGLKEQSLAKEIELLMSLSNVYVALFVNAKTQTFLTDEVDKAKSTVRLIEKKYSLAQAQQSEVLSARVVAVNLEHELLVTQDEHETLLSQFRTLIKRPTAKEFEPALPAKIDIPEIRYSIEELVPILLRNRHALQAAGYQKQAAQAAVTQASLSPLPDFQFTGALNLYHLPSAQTIEGVNRTYSGGLAMTIPLFLPLNELNGIHAARRDRDAAEQQEESQRISAIADLQSMLVKFQADVRQKISLESYVLPATKASYDLMLKAYTLGRADYLKLNDARENWIHSQRDYFQKIQAAAQSYNQITQHVGCELSLREGPHVCQ